jgi:hypothetical protein
MAQLLAAVDSTGPPIAAADLPGPAVFQGEMSFRL